MTRIRTLIVAAGVAAAWSFGVQVAMACPECPAGHAEDDCFIQPPPVSDLPPYPGPSGSPQGTFVCGDGYVGGGFDSFANQWVVTSNLEDGLCLDAWGVDSSGNMLSGCFAEDVTEDGHIQVGACPSEPTAIEVFGVWCSP